MALNFDAAGFAEWLKGRPEIIRDLARRFPPDVAYRHPEGRYTYVVGYEETGHVLVSSLCPFAAYKEATASAKPVHPDCLAALTPEHMGSWTEPR